MQYSSASVRPYIDSKATQTSLVVDQDSASSSPPLPLSTAPQQLQLPAQIINHPQQNSAHIYRGYGKLVEQTAKYLEKMRGRVKDLVGSVKKIGGRLDSEAEVDEEAVLAIKALAAQWREPSPAKRRGAPSLADLAADNDDFTYEDDEL